MIGRYQHSTKESHRRYIKYVELKVADLEQNQTVVNPSAKAKPGTGLQVRPKATPNSAAAHMAVNLPDGDDDWDVETEMFIPVTTPYNSSPMEENVAALQTRMLNLENALTRVINHLEGQTFANQDHQENESA